MPRWEGDVRGTGIADGTPQVREVQALLTALTEPGWVAEDPDDHLLPHLRRACQAPESPWTLDHASLHADGVYEIELLWSRSNGSWRQLRADAFALIGEIAEATTHVRQRIADDAIEYRIATGILTGDAPFAGHGHLLVLRTTGPQILQLIAGSQRPGTLRSPTSLDDSPP